MFPYVKDRDSLSSFTGNGTRHVFPNVKDRDSVSSFTGNGTRNVFPNVKHTQTQTHRVFVLHYRECFSVKNNPQV